MAEEDGKKREEKASEENTGEESIKIDGDDNEVRITSLLAKQADNDTFNFKNSHARIPIENSGNPLEKDPLLTQVNDTVSNVVSPARKQRQTLHDWISALFIRSGLSDKLSEKNTPDIIKRVTKRIILVKKRMRRSPWVLSACAAGASIAIIWSGFFSALIFLISFRFITCLIKIYQILFALLCLSLETNRYIPYLDMAFKVHAWIPILELNIGRGCLQLLTGTFAMDHHPSMIEWFPGLILALTGCFNLINGARCALQIRALMLPYQSTLDEEKKEGICQVGVRASDITEYSSSSILLRQLQMKFDAIDKNKDNKISKEELAESFDDLGMSLSDSDVSMIFHVMDSGGKGYIDFVDFEAWWHREKNLFTAFLV